jgi:hypothetical protein
MKRIVYAVVVASATFVAAARAAETPQGASLADKPVARKDGKAVRISFAVTAPVDVEVSILAADGNVVRRRRLRAVRIGRRTVCRGNCEGGNTAVARSPAIACVSFVVRQGTARKNEKETRVCLNGEKGQEAS